MAQAGANPGPLKFLHNGKTLNWKTDMKALSIDALQFVECRMENSKFFKKLFLKKPNGLCCTVCNTMGMSGKASIDSHMAGKKHLRAIELVVEFRHKDVKNVGGPITSVAAKAAGAATPGKPAGAAATPEKAAGAATPGKAAGAATPGKAAGAAATPGKPAGAATPGKPAGVATPGKPAGGAATPGKPAGVTTPGKPAGAATPGKPAEAATPVKPEGTQTPAKTPAKPATETGKPTTGVAKPAAKPPVKTATPVKPATAKQPEAIVNPAALKSGSGNAPPKVGVQGTPAKPPVTAKTSGTAMKPPGTPASASKIQPKPSTPAGTPKPVAKSATSATGKPTTPATGKPTTPATGKPTTPATGKPATPGSGKPITPLTKPQDNSTKSVTKPVENIATAPENPDIQLKMEIDSSDPIPANNSLASKDPIKEENDITDEVIITNSGEPEVIDLLSDTEADPTEEIPKQADKTVTPEVKEYYTMATLPEKIEVDGRQVDVQLAIKQMKTLRSVTHSLGPSDLQLIEYRWSQSKWIKLITYDNNTKKFNCHVCRNFVYSEFELKNHVTKEKHKSNMNLVRGVFHPIIAPTKLPAPILNTIFSEEKNVEKRRTTPPPPSASKPATPAGKDATPVAKEAAPVPKDAAPPVVAEEQYNFTGPVTLFEFKTKHVFLDVEELLKIEYREKSSIWYSLVCKQGTTYKCALCKTPYLGNAKNIIEHLRGKKHLSSAINLTALHHPKYCPAPGRPVVDGAKDTVASADQHQQKPSVVLNPLAVLKNTTNTTAPNAPVISSAKHVPTRITQPLPPRKPQSVATHPGLQPQPKSNSNQPSFTGKTFSAKADSDNDLEGYIGVEYVVKILADATDPAPRFECSLCELESDGIGMQNHLKSAAHRLKYLDRHFRTCMRDFEQYRKDPSCKNMLAEIARRIAVAVEKHHGRDLPFECLKDEYRLNRPEIMSKVFTFRHASEYSGPGMVHVIDKSTLNELYSNRHKITAQPIIEQKRRTTFDANDATAPKRHRMDMENQRPGPGGGGNSASLDVDEHRRLVDQFLRSTNRESDRRGRRSRSRNKSRERRFGGGGPGGRPRRSRSRSMGRRRSRSNDAWSSYKHMFDHAIRDLETDYKRYERDPETHPLYQKEWKIFWQKRSEELANDGRDSTSYDFQPEWILFWTRRMDQIHDEEIEQLKRKLRDRLNLPYHNHELRDERYHIGNQRKPLSAFSQIRESLDSAGNNVNMSGANDVNMPGPFDSFDMGAGPMDQMQPGGYMGPSGPTPFDMPFGQNMGPGPEPPFNMPSNMGPGPGPGPFGMPPQQMGFDMMSNMGPGSYGMSSNMNMMPSFPMQQQQQPTNMMPPYGMRGNIPSMGTSKSMPKSNMGPMGVSTILGGNKNATNQTKRDDKPIERNILQLTGNPNRQVGRPIESVAKPQEKPLVPVVITREPSPPKRIAPEILRKSIRPAAEIQKKPLPPPRPPREPTPPVDDEPIDTGPLNIVSVLRLLTALEDNLGILGPRVIDLLARALTLEKSIPGSADRVLLNPENSVFLETVREKLRGQIVVGVLDPSKTRAVNQAIRDVTALLNKGILNDEPNLSTTSILSRPKITHAPMIAKVAKPIQHASPSTSTSAIDGVEKHELASKLASALAAQGKTNVTSDQLEQLIAVYSLIEKKQRENEPKQQSLSDLLVDSLKATAASFSGGGNFNRSMGGNMRDDNVGGNRQARYNNDDDNDDFTRQRQPQQQQRQQNYGLYNTNSTNNNNSFSLRNDSNQFQGLSKQQQPSWKSSSTFGLSNFDTSLSLPSLPNFSSRFSLPNLNRNMDNDQSQQRQQQQSQQRKQQIQQQQDEYQQDNSQNTPAFMTNLGRSNLQNQGGDLVAYPSKWQRGGTLGGSGAIPGRSQQAPLGWQKNANNRGQNRGR